jgi:hypothetical protein
MSVASRRVKLSEEQKIFQIIHEIADCILKHCPTVEVLLLEGVEAAKKKGLDPEPLIALRGQVSTLTDTIISLLIPDDQPRLAQIRELWQAIGWLNGAEQHMIDKYQKYVDAKPHPAVASLVQKLPELTAITREIRRQLERELFRSMVEKQEEKV